MLLGSHARLEARLGARIDETNKRIDELDKSLNARIGEVNKRIDELDKRLNARIDETNRRLDGIDNRLRAVEHGQARLEGLMDGLREAISGRRPAA